MEEPREAQPARSRRPWETIADGTARALDDAVKAGFFDNLPGSGRPLDLSDEDNPFIPDDMRLAYRILRNAGYSLPWIEARKDIDAQIAALERRVAAHAAMLRSSAARLQRIPAYLRASRTQLLREHHEQFLVDHARRVDDLNRRIDDFNLSVPVISLQLRRVNRQASQSLIESAIPDDLRRES